MDAWIIGVLYHLQHFFSLYSDGCFIGGTRYNIM